MEFEDLGYAHLVDVRDVAGSSHRVRAGIYVEKDRRAETGLLFTQDSFEAVEWRACVAATIDDRCRYLAHRFFQRGISPVGEEFGYHFVSSHGSDNGYNIIKIMTNKFIKE